MFEKPSKLCAASKAGPIPFESVMMDASAAFILTDSQGLVLTVNSAFSRMTGYSREEVMGLGPPYPFWPDAGEVLERMEPVYEGSMLSCSAETAFLNKDGSVVDVLFAAGREIVTGDGVNARPGIAVDISETMGREASLRATADRCRAAFECMGDAAFTKDAEGRYTMVNGCCCEVFGMPEEAMLGRKDLEIFPEEFALRTAELEREVLKGKTVRTIDTVDLTPVERTYLVTRAPMIDRRGGIIGLCCTMHDTSERGCLEREIMSSQRADTILKTAADIAHNFNNIIYAVTGYATLALSNLDDRRSVETDIEDILKATEMGGDYTKKLLSLGNRIPPRLEWISMVDLLRSVKRSFGMAFPDGIRVEVSYRGCSCLVPADGGRLRKAVMNICLNAVEAMPRGGTVSIDSFATGLPETMSGSLAVDKNRKYFGLVIRDTGAGMSEEAAERAAEPFYTSERNGGHAGLGLTNARMIVEDHDGIIKFRNGADSGTEVEILLPCRMENDRCAGHFGAGGGEKRVILSMIRDDGDKRSAAEELSRIGCEFVSAGPSCDILGLLRFRAVDLVVIDHSPDDVDASAMVRAIRRISDCPIAVIAPMGEEAESTLSELAESGASVFIDGSMGPGGKAASIGEIASRL